ncbi:DUF2235 domain-containing protein [Duganella sp.]|uniref:DUF2235 domain-containing protein n=1 Tax=Duganella sp. TaxID=1904440 RepID=UPI0031D7662C
MSTSAPPPKNIVLFIDGTWNKASNKNITNVRKMFERVYARSGDKQIAHYIVGVGERREAYDELPLWARRAGIPRESGSVFAKVMRKCLGGAIGYGMPAKVMEAYAFLVAHYNPGDRIFLFGFSRGAYAVRSLSCFLEEVGLLLKDYLHEVPRAYRLYSSGDAEGIARLGHHLQALTGFARAGDGIYRLPVHMMGVWDTVGAMRFTDNHVHFRADDEVIDVPENISHVRHALALHELREQFQPLFWKVRQGSGQSLEQVWFAGAHADVGGGYRPAALANIALEWMAWEAQQLGLQTDAAPAAADAAVSQDEVRNSFAPWYGYTAPQLRPFLSEAEESFFDKNLDSFAVHYTAAKRIEHRHQAGYSFLWPEVDQCLAAVDEATINLAWALGLTRGRLLAGCQQADIELDPQFIEQVRQAIPEKFRNLAEAGDRIQDARSIIKGAVRQDAVDIDDFAMSILVYALLVGDIHFGFIVEQLQQLHSELVEMFDSGEEPHALALIGARIRVISRGLTVAAHLAPNAAMCETLLKLAHYAVLCYAVEQKAAGAVKRLKKVKKI